MGITTPTEFILLLFGGMISKLVFLAWVIWWLRRKAVLDEAWEHENAWDDGWSQRAPEADWDNLLLDLEHERVDAEHRNSDRN